MIILNGTSGLVRLSLELHLDHAVALKDPELWVLQGQDWSKINPTASNSSGSSWEGVARPGGEGDLNLQLYWQAFDPMKATWRYNAHIRLTDQDGILLPGAMGHVNPASAPCDLKDHWDHGQTGIYIFWGG